MLRKVRANKYFIFGFLGLFAYFSSSFALAITSDIARWYRADSPIENNRIVSISAGQPDKIELASTKLNNSLLGVSTEDGDALASIDRNSDEKNVQVTIAGRSKVRVNLSNGPISQGDLVGVSDKSGIGAKAKQGQPVIGVAESSFGEKQTKPSENEGEVALLIAVGIAPVTDVNSGWISSVAGKNVSAMQMAFLFLIAIIAVISIIVLTYSSIKNSFVAAGRNPMAKPAILRVLFQVMIMVCIVAIVSFGLMFFILRL